MSEPFDIQSYMTHGVERVVSDIIKATFKNPKESAYMAKFALASRAASRETQESGGRRGTYSAFPDCQHNQPVQSALRGLLFPLQSCHGGYFPGAAADR